MIEVVRVMLVWRRIVHDTLSRQRFVTSGGEHGELICRLQAVGQDTWTDVSWPATSNLTDKEKANES